MKVYSVSTSIKATPEVIWEILTNAPAYPEWDPGMVRIEGRIELGEKIKVFTKLSPDRTFPVTVSEFVPNQSMTWTGGMPLGLFKGQRTFSLFPIGDGNTEFSMKEEFGGPLLPIFGRSIPDLTPSFQDFADGLKKRAEGTE